MKLSILYIFHQLSQKNLYNNQLEFSFYVNYYFLVFLFHFIEISSYRLFFHARWMIISFELSQFKILTCPHIWKFGIEWRGLMPSGLLSFTVKFHLISECIQVFPLLYSVLQSFQDPPRLFIRPACHLVDISIYTPLLFYSPLFKVLSLFHFSCHQPLDLLKYYKWMNIWINFLMLCYFYFQSLCFVSTS